MPRIIPAMPICFLTSPLVFRHARVDLRLWTDSLCVDTVHVEWGAYWGRLRDL